MLAVDCQWLTVCLSNVALLPKVLTCLTESTLNPEQRCQVTGRKQPPISYYNHGTLVCSSSDNTIMFRVYSQVLMQYPLA
jgi:hypothetical protein